MVRNVRLSFEAILHDIESLKFKVFDFNLFPKKNKELSISKTGRCVAYVSHKTYCWFYGTHMLPSSFEK